MPDLLIAPPAAPSVSPSPSPKASPATPAAEPKANANASAGASEQTNSGTRAAPAEPGRESTPATFANVLKQQMGQAKEVKTKAATLPVDPLSIAAEALPELQGSATSALIPFIEQLLPQLAKKYQNAEEATTAVADPALALAASDTGAAMIAAPIIPGVVAAQQAMAATPVLAAKGSVSQQGALDESAANADVALPTQTLDPASSEQAEPAQASVAGADLAAASAISAESAESPLVAGSKPEHEFSALVARATEQLASTSQSSSASSHLQANTTAASDTSLRMDTPVGHADWSKELGNKLSWMASAQRQQADLVLNPPQLGRVEISLTVSGDQASAVFSSPSAAVRELLEDSLPRLREILSGSGINLGEAQVGSESPNRFGMQDQGNDNRGRTHVAATLGLNDGLPAVAGERTIASGRGMVDIFA